MTTANTAIRNAMAIFGSAPVPNQMMQSGAIATLGTLLSADEERKQQPVKPFPFGDDDGEEHAEYGGDSKSGKRNAQRIGGLLREPQW